MESKVIEVSSAQDATRPWDAWLDSPPGRYVLRWEQAQLDAAVADVFGFHALQCGLPQLDALRANRMPNRMAARTARDAPAWRAACDGDLSAGVESGATDAASVRSIVTEPFEEMPFASASLDLVVLPHALDLADDPHQVLREAERVLRPEGRVIVTGFNPVSLWGARQAALRSLVRPFMPLPVGMVGIARLRDWMRLLSLEPDRGRFGCYVPPCRTERWLDRLQWVERAGDRWWPICGALYLLSAVKRVRGMRLIGPAWKAAPRKAAAAVAGPVRRDDAGMR